MPASVSLRVLRGRALSNDRLANGQCRPLARGGSLPCGEAAPAGRRGLRSRVVAALDSHGGGGILAPGCEVISLLTARLRLRSRGCSSPAAGRRTCGPTEGTEPTLTLTSRRRGGGCPRSRGCRGSLGSEGGTPGSRRPGGTRRCLHSAGSPGSGRPIGRSARLASSEPLPTGLLTRRLHLCRLGRCDLVASCGRRSLRELAGCRGTCRAGLPSRICSAAPKALPPCLLAALSVCRQRASVLVPLLRRCASRYTLL